MAQALFYSSNAVAMTLAAGIASGDTTCNLSSTSGLPASFPFKLLIGWGTAQQEVVHCTALSGVVATITRGLDGTTAQAHSIGATVVHGVSAREFNDLELHVGSTAAVHGITGSVVGTTDTQTLTNKTFDATSNVSGAPLVGTTTVQTLTNKTLVVPTATPSVSTGQGIIVKGLTSQSGNPVEIQDVNANVIWTVKSTGNQIIHGSATDGAALFLWGNADTSNDLSIRHAGTGNYIACQNAAGTPIAGVDNSGNIFATNLTNAWTAYTPTFTNITGGAGTFAYNLVGKTLNIRGIFSAGTATAAGQCSISLPASLTSAVAGTSTVGGFVGTSNLPWQSTHATALSTAFSLTLGQSLVGATFTGTVEVA